MPYGSQRKRCFAPDIDSEQGVHLRIDEPADDLSREFCCSRGGQKIGQDGAVVPAEVAIRAGAIFPGVPPICTRTNDDYRRVCHGRMAARGIDDSLAVVSGAELAQAELGGSEVIYAGGQSRGIAALQIGTHHVQFDFVKRAGAGGGAKKNLCLLLFFAAGHASGEEQQLRQCFHIGNGIRRHGSVRGPDGGKCRRTGVSKITRQARDLECGINLEQKRLIVPVQNVRLSSHAEIGMLRTGVILPRSIKVFVLAQKARLLGRAEI
jgi:hypothetical protein